MNYLSECNIPLNVILLRTTYQVDASVATVGRWGEENNKDASLLAEILSESNRRSSSCIVKTDCACLKLWHWTWTGNGGDTQPLTDTAGLLQYVSKFRWEECKEITHRVLRSSRSGLLLPKSTQCFIERCWWWKMEKKVVRFGELLTWSHNDWM